MPPVSGAPRSNFLTHLAAFLAALGAFVAAAWVISTSLPFPEVPALFPKYKWLGQHRDAYDTLFVGSSRFYHQIIPEEFNAAVEKLTGFKPRSFNAAYDAVWPPESFYFLRKLLALKLHGLRYVVIDAMNINPKLEDPEHITRRQAYWHDWRHTRMAIDATFESPRPPEEARALAWNHVVVWLKQCVSLGRGAEWIFAHTQPIKTKAEKIPEWDGAEGFHEGGTKGMEGEKLKEYLNTVERLRQELPPVEAGPAFATALRDISDFVRAAGAEPIFVIPPTLNELENLARIPGGAKLIPLNAPSKEPLLYDPALHYDGWHLNKDGAHIFTQRLAEEFAGVVLAKAKGHDR